MALTPEDIEAQRLYAMDANLDSSTLQSYTKEAIDYLRHMGTSLEAEKKKLAGERAQKELNDLNVNTRASGSRNNNTTSSIRAPRPTLRVNGIQPLREEPSVETATSKKIEAVAEAVKELTKNSSNKPNTDLQQTSNEFVEPSTIPIKVEQSTAQSSFEQSNSEAILPLLKPTEISVPTTNNDKQESAPGKLPTSTEAPPPQKKDDNQPIIQNITIEQERELREEYPMLDFDKPPKNNDEAEQLERFKKDLYTKMSERKKVESTNNSMSSSIAQVDSLQPLYTEPSVKSTNAVESEREQSSLTMEQKQELRKEYSSIFNFDKPSKDENEAKQLDRLERDLYTEMMSRKAKEANNGNQTAPEYSTSAKETASVSTTIEPDKNITPIKAENSDILNNPSLISKQASDTVEAKQTPAQSSESAAADQKTEPVLQTEPTATKLQQSPEPVESPAIAMPQSANKPATTDPTENIMKNILTVNSNMVAVLYSINTSLGEILKSVGSLGSLTVNEGGSIQSKPSSTTTVNDGAINTYRGSFRFQNSVNNTQLRPTTPGFTV